MIFQYTELLKQEAQLSQRDRAMLHVIGDLAKSLTQDHSRSFEMTLLHKGVSRV